MFGHPFDGNDERWIGGVETLARVDNLRTESFQVLDGGGVLSVVRLVRPDGRPYEESIRFADVHERERLRARIDADWGEMLADARRRRRAPAA